LTLEGPLFPPWAAHFLKRKASGDRVPCTATVDGTRRHKFYIPGILFILFLGEQVPNRFDARALNGSRQRVMWVCPWENDSLFPGVLGRIKASTPVGKLTSYKSARITSQSAGPRPAGPRALAAAAHRAR
jgi:hypothetical protein